jgi:uncharacterized protein (DUF58 family)
MRRALALLLTAAALFAAAGRTASLALFALAVGIVAVVVGARVAVAVAARRLAVARRVSAREAREDEAFEVRFDVHGLGGLPVSLEAQVGQGEWLALEERGGTVQLTVSRRGAHRLAPSPLRLRDAFGLFERSVLAGEPQPLLILPAPDDGVRPGAHLGAPADDADPDGLQPYTAGTPMSRIHWPALARGAGLHARRLVAPPTGLPLVVVDTEGTSDPRAVDWAARVAAGHVTRLVRNGGCRVLLSGDLAATPVTDLAGQWRGVHRRLALLEPGARVAVAVEEQALRIRAARAPSDATGVPLQPLPPGVEPAADERRAPMPATSAAEELGRSTSAPPGIVPAPSEARA